MLSKRNNNVVQQCQGSYDPTAAHPQRERALEERVLSKHKRRTKPTPKEWFRASAAFKLAGGDSGGPARLGPLLLWPARVSRLHAAFGARMAQSARTDTPHARVLPVRTLCRVR